MERLYNYLLMLLLVAGSCFSCSPGAKYPGKDWQELESAVVAKMAPFLANVDIVFVDSKDTSMAQVSCDLFGEYCVVEQNKEEMDRIKEEYGDNVAVWILAHELSHIQHFYPFTYGDISTKVSELEADEAGGCIVKLLGYSDSNMRRFVYKELQADEESTHPQASDRWDAFSRGYDCTEN